jgi:hypothetical protein
MGPPATTGADEGKAPIDHNQIAGFGKLEEIRLLNKRKILAFAIGHNLVATCPQPLR